MYASNSLQDSSPNNHTKTYAEATSNDSAHQNFTDSLHTLLFMEFKLSLLKQLNI